MAKQFQFSTYNRIKSFFTDNPDKEMTATFVRDETHQDYNTVKAILSVLLEEGYIVQQKNRYKKRRNADGRDKGDNGDKAGA